MASCVWQSISLTFLWTTFFVRIFLHDCMTLRQSGLAVFPVDSCPRNLSEVETATLRLNCSDVKGFRNVYHCLPVSNLSLLVEFCYNRTSGLTGEGNCLVLSNEYINIRQCNHFTSGCPSVPYYYKEMFNFPECTQINKQNSCYEADPICPNISFVEGTTRPTVNAMENNTVLVGATTRLTVIAVENNSVLVEPTTISAFDAMQNPAVQIAIVLGVFLPPISIALICWILRRHIRARKETPIEQGVTVLMATEDNAANKLERSYLCDNIEDNKANRQAAFFKKKGTSVRFNKLRLDLIRGIPDRELNSLKASLQVMTELSTENVETIEGFFTFLFDEGIFQERNVIVMQSLMKSINRPDLERRCVEYAKEDNQAICFFEETTAPGDGNKHVLLHVVDDIEQFTEMEDLIATVAAIVGCHRSCIELVGVRPDSSFIIVISMKEEFARKLRQNDPFGLFGLSKYNVDWIKVENEVTDIAQDTPNESKERSLLMATEDNGANEHTLSGLKKTASLMEKENISSDNSATEKMDNFSTSSGTETEMREEGGKADRYRYYKLGSATYGVLLQACRDILEMEIPSSDIENKVKSSPRKIFLSPDQKHLLRKAKQSGYENFDVSLTYTLIINICSYIPKPTKGKWGGNSMPAAEEMTVGDDIERIRLIEDNFSANVRSTSTTQTEFNNTWSFMSDICQRLETFTGKKYLDTLNQIRKMIQ